MKWSVNLIDMETRDIWIYLNGLITKSVFPVCFSGDKECILNRWLVKGERIYQEADNSPWPGLIPHGELILPDDRCYISGQTLESNWRYYISDLKNHAYTYNAPQTLFIEEDKYIYSVSGVYCTTEQELYVYFGMTSPAPARVWINGRLVFISHDNYAQRKAYLRFVFKKGKNIILVERTIKAGGAMPSKDTVGFCVKLKPYNKLLEHAKKAAIFHEGLPGDNSCSYQIVPHKLYFAPDEDIGLMVLPKCFREDKDEKIRVGLLNSKDEEIISLDTVTSANLSVKLDAGTYGIVNIKVRGLENGGESSLVVFRGDFSRECDRLMGQAADRADCGTEITDVMRWALELPDSLPSGVYTGQADHRLCRYKLLKYLEFERYLERPEVKTVKGIFDVFVTGVLKTKAAGTGCSGVTYGIYLPNGYMHGKEYPLVIYMPGSVDGSIYPECPDFISKGELNDAIAVCLGGIQGIQNDGTDSLNILVIISEIFEMFNINRGRVYLIGAREGAFEGIRLSMRIPHLFTAVAVFYGSDGIKTDRQDTVFFKNTSNTMFYQICSMDNYGINGIRALDVLEHAERSRKWILQGFQEDELLDMFNSKKLLEELLKESRPDNPALIGYTTSEPIYNRSFWLKIEYIDDLGCTAGIRAEIKDGHRIDISTGNIRRFSLLVDKEAMGLQNTVEVNVNGTRLKLCTGKYARAEFNLDADSPGLVIHELSRDGFIKEYESIDVKGEQLGIKGIYMDKYLLVRPGTKRHGKNVFSGRLLNTLQNPQNRVNNSSMCGAVFENEISGKDLSSTSFIYVIDCEETEHVFFKKWKSAELEFDSISIRFRDSRFWGEYFAIIKCKNPYNPGKSTLLCIYNSKNSADELEGFMRTFNRIALFYSEAIISNNGNYYSYR